MARGPGVKLSWWQKALVRLALKAAGTTQPLSLVDPSGWSRALALLGNPSATGKTVSDETAMRVTVVWACNKILSESVGMLPWAIYERGKDGNATKVDHPLAEVLVAQPNSDMTSQEFREACQLNLGLHGNAYCFTERTTKGEVFSLYPIPAPNVVPQRNDETKEITYKITDRGKQETFPREKIWHVKGFGGTGLVGLSPIGAAREAMGLAMATEEFQARFFGQGARPSAIAKIPQWLDKDQRVIARENLQQLLGGLENAHRVHLLEGGMELDTWGQPLDDLQFVELRQFQLTEICRLYRIPPHMVADLSRATFSNIEQMSLEFVTFTLMPWLTRFETSIARWLLKREDRAHFFARFNFEGLLRADSKGRAEYYTAALQNGWMNRNEVRAKENQNSVEGLDIYTAQLNLTPVDQLPRVAGAAAPRKEATEESPSEIKFARLVGEMNERFDDFSTALEELSHSISAAAERADARAAEFGKLARVK